MTDPFHNLPRNHYGAILADPPWNFKTWTGEPNKRGPQNHYGTMQMDDIAGLPLQSLAARDCVLFVWVCWPILLAVPAILETWGFEYKTCAFAWIKADNTQPDMFDQELKTEMKLGYWTRSNSEVCLLATRGKPKRIDAGVRQAIVAPAREHSRKPDGIHSRIERLVAGPYLELFARAPRAGWDVWGNQTDKFKEAAE